MIAPEYRQLHRAIPTERHCRRCNWTRCHTCSNWYRHPGLTH